jgi:hypothetical protein
MPSQVIRIDQLRSLAAGSISSSYATVGGPLAHPTRLIKLVNNTNADCVVSVDGVNDNDYLPAGSFALYDVTTNRGNPDPYFVFQTGTQFLVKSTGAPSTGSFYVVAMYGQGE